jgi:elongation factor P
MALVTGSAWRRKLWLPELCHGKNEQRLVAVFALTLAYFANLWSWSAILDRRRRTGAVSNTNPSRQMKINGNEIRTGNVIEHDGGLWVAVRTNHVKPGKGGAYNQVELKNLINGTKLNERFRSAETVEKVRLEQKDFSFLYEQGEALIFMDTDSYEQLELQKDFVGDRAAFLQDGMMVTVELYDERPIGISLPDYVTLAITEADPVVKGQTAASSYKPAVLENGIRVLVPPFISSGERIVVDTNELTYVRRAD